MLHINVARQWTNNDTWDERTLAFALLLLFTLSIMAGWTLACGMMRMSS